MMIVEIRKHDEHVIVDIGGHSRRFNSNEEAILYLQCQVDEFQSVANSVIAMFEQSLTNSKN